MKSFVFGIFFVLAVSVQAATEINYSKCDALLAVEISSGEESFNLSVRFADGTIESLDGASLNIIAALSQSPAVAYLSGSRKLAPKK